MGAGEANAVTVLGAGAFIGVMHLRGLATDTALLASTQADPEAFAQFYTRYERLVIGYLMRRVKDAETAADLAAEVFAAALESAPSYQPAGPSAAPWLLAIAHNTLVSSWRRGQVEEDARRRMGMLGVIELSDASLERIEQTVADEVWVADVLSRLPEDQREAVRARVIDDRSYGEIATQLSVSALVVRKRVSRGLARLRAELEE